MFPSFRCIGPCRRKPCPHSRTLSICRELRRVLQLPQTPLFLDRLNGNQVMIQYSLKCANDHSFDSWFQSGSAFDKLHSAGMVSCAICGSTDVRKQIMAPRVSTSRTKTADPVQPAQPSPNQQPAHSLSTPSHPAEQALKDLKAQIEKNSTYVGDNFATEARAMHLGEKPDRQIHGEARPEEAKKLIEDGIPVMPLPFMTGRKTN